ncbi:protein kinase [Achlya hypogyna]|uniref:Protein kinase n=1 Tax=Achlya hypogyna TaxID=1202772 RepID=A0A1V9Y5V3_ACHHY|nr:protein kinase [Achlya hypogyna]
MAQVVVTPLYTASEEGDTEVVQRLIASGADINQPAKNGWTPITVAATNGHLAVVKALIAAGADFNKDNLKGWTSIMAAATGGHLAVVQALIEAGADFNKTDVVGWTPINAAAYHGHLPVVNALMAAGADFHKENNTGYTPQANAYNKGHTTTVDAFDAALRLVEAVNNGDETLVRELLEQGVSPNVLVMGGQTLLHIAVSMKPTPPSRNLKRFDEVSVEIVKLLLDAGAVIDRQIQSGPTPLTLAAWHGCDGAVALLLEAGADFNLADSHGDTALHKATSQGHKAIVRKLVAAGASFEKPNTARHMGQTPRDIAIANSSNAIMGIMAARPLLEAVTAGDVVRAKELLAQGADPNAFKTAGEMLLQRAARFNDLELLDALLRAKSVDTAARNEVEATDIDVAYTEMLGSGGFSLVYKGVFENQPVAVKTALDPLSVDALGKELLAMQLCKSPYLLHLVAFSGLNTPHLLLVLEYMDGGNLREYLDKKRKGIAVAVEYSALEVAWVVANALADLHHNKVLHRDLKSYNVLLSSTNYIKVADLGLARTYASHMTMGLGTVLWTAPEVLQDEGSYDYAADIYSFGVILTELGTLKMPFQDLAMQHLDIVFQVREGKLHPDVGDTSPKWLRELATDCMSFDPAQRPSALEIIKRLNHQRRLEASALSTEMACSMCKISHSMANDKCPHCVVPLPQSATMKLQRLLERVAVAKEMGTQIETAQLCRVCGSANDITITKCSACDNEMPNDDEKLRLLVEKPYELTTIPRLRTVGDLSNSNARELYVNSVRTIRLLGNSRHFIGNVNIDVTSVVDCGLASLPSELPYDQLDTLYVRYMLTSDASRNALMSINGMSFKSATVMYEPNVCRGERIHDTCSKFDGNPLKTIVNIAVSSDIHVLYSTWWTSGPHSPLSSLGSASLTTFYVNATTYANLQKAATFTIGSTDVTKSCATPNNVMSLHGNNVCVAAAPGALTNTTPSTDGLPKPVPASVSGLSTNNYTALIIGAIIGGIVVLIAFVDLALLRLDDLALVRQQFVAEGAYGQVWYGTYRGESVAIKSLAPTRASRTDIALLMGEIKLSAQLESPYIVRTLGASWRIPSELQMVLEWMDRGDLKNVLDTTSPETFPWAAKFECMLAIAEGLVYLHSLDIIHRDLKSRNVLLDSAKGTKLTDFGTSRDVTTATMTVGVGTYRWMAPEVLQDSTYSTAVDIYSFGVVISELATHEIPYGNLLNEKGAPLADTAIISRVTQGQAQPVIPVEGCPPWIASSGRLPTVLRLSKLPTPLGNT